MDFVSALVIIAPHPVQAFAVPLMRQYCFESLLRVPAHITVLFPFASIHQLDKYGTVSRTLRDLCASLPPLDITLDSYGQFPTVTYLKPRDPEPIKATFRAIHAAFPGYLPYNGQFGNDDITPHMTVGEFHNQAERDQAVYPAFEPISFRVSRLHLIAGVNSKPIPWVTQDVFWLGSS